MKKILFADRDAKHLEETRNALNVMREHWDMRFVFAIEDARKALEDEDPYDMIISDIPFHDVEGTELIFSAMNHSPDSIRFVLSEPLDRRTVMNLSSVAHQFLAKPIDGQKLRNFISRALALQNHMKSNELRRALLRVGMLPAVPTLYSQLMKEMQSPDVSVASVAEIIEQDPAMSTKVLQIVNSAGVGLVSRVSNILHAATLLGIENLKAFVLMAETFAAFKVDLPPQFDIDALWEHGLTVGTYARKIAESETINLQITDHAYMAGLLHDVGLIILAARLPEELSDAKKFADRLDISLCKAEKEIIGATHAEIGGYVMDLWGLPHPVVEGIMFHDLPSSRPQPEYEEAPDDSFSPLTAVHAANYFCQDANQHELDAMNPQPELDSAYLELLEVTDRVEEWYDLCLA